MIAVNTQPMPGPGAIHAVMYSISVVIALLRVEDRRKCCAFYYYYFKMNGTQLKAPVCFFFFFRFLFSFFVGTAPFSSDTFVIYTTAQREERREKREAEAPPDDIDGNLYRVEAKTQGNSRSRISSFSFVFFERFRVKSTGNLTKN